MRENGNRSERGQTLIIVAFALVALLAFAGLAVDGGAAYLNRRRMQNAADAGALAGTRMLANATCGQQIDGVYINDTHIASEVNRFAENNGVLDTDGVPGNAVNGNVTAYYVKFDANGNLVYTGEPPVLVGGGSIPTGATGISATTVISRPTFLLNLVGQPTTGAQGRAIAVSGPLYMSGGIRPFGVPQELVETLGEGDVFTIDFDNDGGSFGGAYVAQHRGWMNLGYIWNQSEEPIDYPRADETSLGVGATGQDDSMASWMAYGWDGTLFADCGWDIGCVHGDYVHAAAGSKASVVKEAEELPGSGEIIIVPVYDEIVECDDSAPNPPAPKAACPSAGGGYVYHISGFTALEVTGVDQGAKELTLELLEAIIGFGQVNVYEAIGYQPGSMGGCDMELQVVTLWE